MISISPVFVQSCVKFVLLPYGQKFPPLEKEWQKKGHGFKEAAAHDGNIGVMAGNGYIGLDQDKPEAFEGLELPNTTKWMTRPGRFGLWFKCDENIADILKFHNLKPDQAQLYLYNNENRVGEIKLERTYQVIPPSWKKIDETKVNYEFVNEVPPAVVSLSQLMDELDRIGITFSKKQEDKKYEKEQPNTLKIKEILQDKRINKCLQHLTKQLANGKIKRLEEEATCNGESEHKLRLAWATALIKAGYEDSIVHELCNNFDDYDQVKTQQQVDSIRKFVSGGGNYTSCKELSSIMGKQCMNCKWKPPKKESLGKVREEQPVKEAKYAPEIERKACKILEAGVLDMYWKKVFLRRHDGDEHVAMAMPLANLTANIKNSHGIAVLEVNGPSGDGKSHAVQTAAEMMGRWCDKSGMSPMALLYHAGKTIHTGMMVVLDDNRPDDKQADFIKRNQTEYKTGYKYKTVDAQRNPITVQVPPGVQIISTQVDAKSEEEVLNRTLSLEVKGDAEKDNRIIIKDLKQLETGDNPLDDPGIAVCQCAYNKLKEHEYVVKIPNASKCIKWHERTKDGRMLVRNYNIFIDLVLSFAVMRNSTREHTTRDDGVIEVVATRQDFDDALDLYKKIHKQMVTKLTSSEEKLLKLVVDAGGRLLREDALEKMGISDGRLSQLVNGKDGNGGLRNKVPGFRVEKSNVQISDAYGDYERKRESVNRSVLCAPCTTLTAAVLNGEIAEWVEVEEDTVNAPLRDDSPLESKHDLPCPQARFDYDMGEKAVTA